MQEATVLGFDTSTQLIQVEYTEETMMKLKSSKVKERGKLLFILWHNWLNIKALAFIQSLIFFLLGKPGKFELQMDCEDDEGEPQKSAEIKLDELIEPKLVT